jgi:hypothetical protein
MSKNCVAVSGAPAGASVSKTQKQPTPISLFHAMTAKTSPTAAFPPQTAGSRRDFLNAI